MIALISVLCVVLLGLIGAVLFVTLGKDDSVTAADTQPAATTQVAADASSQPNPPVTTLQSTTYATASSRPPARSWKTARLRRNAFFASSTTASLSASEMSSSDRLCR